MRVCLCPCVGVFVPLCNGGCLCPCVLSPQEQESYEVKQFHYTGWPDFGVPEMPHPLIAFIRRLENFKRTTDGPDILHCRYV